MSLEIAQRDRAIGAVVASAAGDALGAPYEFNPPIAADIPVELCGGGAFGWSPGEWTDDTSMAIVILQQLADGASLIDPQTQDRIVAGWANWAASARDVGVQTRTILSQMSNHTREEALSRAGALHDRTGKTAGNGSLMRTGPVALGSLDSADTTARAARELSDLTHFDSDAGDACVLWSLAIRLAICDGVLDLRAGIKHLPIWRQAMWSALIDEAEANEPAFFDRNGWVIHAFQCAWSAIHKAVTADASLFEFEAQRLQYGLEQAVRAGFDTDTVAAIAGSLLGAYLGSTAVPATWRLKLHGWPGIDERDLTFMTNVALNQPNSRGVWPSVAHFDYTAFSGRHELVRHPRDSGLWLGGVASLAKLPSEVTAVVSLCRVGLDDVPSNIKKRLEVYLMDKNGRENNLNADFLLADIADAVKTLRDEGHVVYLHCVQSQSRTPSVAASYSMRHFGQTADAALAEIKHALPSASPIGDFVSALKRRGAIAVN